ncbi:hypothetical protein B7P34_00975 [Streptosporangium nondiastaticum]|uniref:Uncharacterized protein n=1 Tax=Streptosporangium nondiastaticum TaxID=35764 RepID=A0A9X7JVI3_9ACTN|nr:hypothetical protein [Streptosporangium nondiastaticum]PSJ30612.1 hypothetical protein B7P34_00975 [Streptosporangium nondiastaticum]
MAIAFELVVNFGHDVEAAQRARAIAAGWPALTAGGHRIGLHPAALDRVSSEYSDGTYAELSVVPVGVGMGVALDRALPQAALTSVEFTQLGRGLYDLLTQFDGYQAAKVGWDPESLVDVDCLRAEWADELARGALDGLVLSERLRDSLGAVSLSTSFAPGFVWIPWRGARPSALTADRS